MEERKVIANIAKAIGSGANTHDIVNIIKDYATPLLKDPTLQDYALYVLAQFSSDSWTTMQDIEQMPNYGGTFNSTDDYYRATAAGQIDPTKYYFVDIQNHNSGDI